MTLLRVKVVLLGEPKVGKTSIRRSFMGFSFQSNYLATIGSDFSTKNVMVGDKKVNLMIWDLAGQPIFETILPIYFQGAAVGVVVFDLTDLSTLHKCGNWIRKYVENSGFDRNLVYLVGNKLDLVREDDLPLIDQEISSVMKRLGDEYEDSISYLLHIKTSAKTGENVPKMFSEIGEKMVRQTVDGRLNYMGKKTSDISKVFPWVYYAVFNELLGPLPVASFPMTAELRHDATIIKNVVRLFSSLDFEQIIKERIHMGRIPWSEPSGSAFYIAFVKNNPKARGGYELHATIAIASIEYSSLAISKENTLLGLLHSSVNKISSVLANNSAQIVTSLPDDIPDKLTMEIGEVLGDIRDKMYEYMME